MQFIQSGRRLLLCTITILLLFEYIWVIVVCICYILLLHTIFTFWHKWVLLLTSTVFKQYVVAYNYYIWGQIILLLTTYYMSLVMRKPAFCVCKNKDADQLRSSGKLISAFVFATRLVQSFFYLNPKFKASSHLLWFFSPYCVGPGRKPRRQVFSRQGSYSGILLLHTIYYIQEQTYCIQFLYLGSYWCIQFLYLVQSGHCCIPFLYLGVDWLFTVTIFGQIMYALSTVYTFVWKFQW